VENENRRQKTKLRAALCSLSELYLPFSIF
jgi:hypothetical protein